MEISFEDSTSIPVFNKKVCRVCLNDSTRLKNLYIKKNLDVLEKLRSFIEIEDQTTSELPEWICLNCTNSLNSAFEFKDICIQNDKKLRYMLQKSKEAKNNEVKEEEELREILSDLVEAKIEEFDLKDESEIECNEASSDDLEFNDPDNSSESDSNEDEDEQNKKSDYQCNLCNKEFTGKSSLLRHDTIVHCSKKYSCEICNKKYRYKKYLQSHMETFHDPNKIVISTKVSKTKKTKTFKCRECSMLFTNSTEYRKHHSANHMQRIHKCDICSKMFKTLQILNTHKITHLTFEERNKSEYVKKYLCPICGKVLYSSSNRDSHVRGHSGEKPFKCTVCEKAFKQKNLLNVHMSKHSEDRPFKCEICGNCFKNQTQFSSHQLTHKLKDMEKQFDCKICGVKFRYKLNLTHHMKNIHLGIRNYKCDLCDQAFYTSNLMRQHKTKKHHHEELQM